MSRYEGEDAGDFQDRVTDEAIQNEVDDAADKRNASQTSPEILSLQDAGNEGRRAGMLGLGPYSNPFDHESPEHAEWEKHRTSTIGARLNRRAS